MTDGPNWTDLRAWLRDLQGDQGPEPDDDPDDFAVPLVRLTGELELLRRVGAKRYEAFGRRARAELHRRAERIRRRARFGAIKFDAPEFMQVAEEIQREVEELDGGQRT